MFCKERELNGGIITGPTLREFFDYLAEELDTEQLKTELEKDKQINQLLTKINENEK